MDLKNNKLEKKDEIIDLENEDINFKMEDMSIEVKGNIENKIETLDLEPENFKSTSNVDSNGNDDIEELNDDTSSENINEADNYNSNSYGKNTSDDNSSIPKEDTAPALKSDEDKQILDDNPENATEKKDSQSSDDENEQIDSNKEKNKSDNKTDDNKENNNLGNKPENNKDNNNSGNKPENNKENNNQGNKPENNKENNNQGNNLENNKENSNLGNKSENNKENPKDKSAIDNKREQAKHQNENNKRKSPNKSNNGSNLKDKLKNKAKNKAKDMAKNAADNAKNKALDSFNNSGLGQTVNNVKDKVDKAKKAVNTAKKTAKAAKTTVAMVKLIIGALVSAWPIVLGVLCIIIVIVCIAGILGVDANAGYSGYSSYTGGYYCTNITVEGKEYPLEEYVARVIAQELGTAQEEGLKAQAVLARTFVLKKTSDGKCSISNSQNEQTLKTGNIAQKYYDAANATAGVILTYEGKLTGAYYATFPNGVEGSQNWGEGGCGPITCEGGSCTTKYYKYPSKTPWNFTMPETNSSGNYWNGSSLTNQAGHCHGVSQLGILYYEEQGKKFDEILKIFYDDGVELSKIEAANDTGGGIVDLNIDPSKSGGTHSITNNTGYYEVIGTFKSNITGLTHYIVNQGRISGWGAMCNRGAATILLSGYDKDLKKVENSVPNAWTGNTAFLDTYNLVNEEVHTSGQGDGRGKIANLVATHLPQGGYVVFRIGKTPDGNRGATTTNNTRGGSWATAGHWIIILGVRQENGKNEMFVAESGHGLSGWYPINEFESLSSNGYVQYINVVSQKNK